MLDNRDPAHYLKALKTTTTPKRLLWLDCTAQASHEQGLMIDRWSGGALGTTHYTSRNHERRDTFEYFTDAKDLWAEVERFCTPGRRVVLWGYDLAYQLRVSQALVHLPANGWRVDRIVLERQSAWALFRNGECSLMCCDLMSWLPIGLDRIIGDLASSHGIIVPPKSDKGLSGTNLKVHVVALREAVLQILAWIEAEDLGGFRPTGSGQSYTAFRRRFMSHKFLVHDDMERIRAERVAMWTGRCEAWRHGHLTDGPYVEYDMHSAYCHIAHECAVPTIATSEVWNPTPARVIQDMRRYAILADITVTTRVPCLPASMGGRTLWPVGTFRTVVWDPELSLAFEHCDSVTIHKAYRYHRAPALRDFAGYVLDNLDDPSYKHGPIPRRVLKHWSRCLVGRLGLRFRTWQPFGYQDTPDLRLVTFIDTDEGTSTDMLIAGHDRMILSDMTEALESLPQVPGWVMSECRRRLWRAMCEVKHHNVVYCDTDSLVVADPFGEFAPPRRPHLPSPEWSAKGRYERMSIYGPRNLVAETTRRVSGLPLTARQTAPLEFSGQVMRSIKESMRAGQLDCVASLPRKFVLDAPDMRRQHLPDGQTRPFEVTQSTTGGDDAAYRY